jgi:UDP-3-O-[3-hydroxymyristoyl] glucosamine N-acyltransferase
VRGDASVELRGLAPLDEAGPEQLSFLARPDYRERARASRAGAIIAGPAESLPGRTVLVSTDPYRSFALAMRLFHPEQRPAPGIAPSAVIDPSAQVDDGAHVGALVVVGRDCRIGDGVVLHPTVVVREGCEIGVGSTLHPGVVLYPGTQVGRGVVVHARAVLGSDGFGYSSGADGHLKIPQVGRVVVEDDVEIGAGACIDRGAMGDTRIGTGTRIDNLVQIGHNVHVGAHGMIVAQSGISGSSTLGAFVALAGQSGVAGHLALGDGAQVAAKSAVLSDVGAGERVGGIPAIALGNWKRAAIAFARLPEVLRRLRRLEQAAGIAHDDTGAAGTSEGAGHE